MSTPPLQANHNSIDKDVAVQELSAARPCLRSDLRFTFQVYAGQPCYVIEDPVQNRFYRVGVAEFKFMLLMDGKTSIAQAMRLMSAAMGAEALEEREVTQIVAWALQTQLMYSAASREAEKLAQRRGKEQKRLPQRLADVLFMRIALLNPDRWLGVLLPYCRWLWGYAGAVLWLVLVLSAGYLIAQHWSRFVLSSHGLLHVSNWLWLYLAWLFLKAVHETAHGLVCKYHGGTVPEMGVVLIFLSPLGYVEVTSAWAFPSRWQRVHVSFAGMYAELMIAALATMVWATSPVGLVRNFSYNLIIMASVTTLLFNLNPLMRFDGYYILSDLLDKPNLYQRSRQYLIYLAKRYLLQVPVVFHDQGWGDRMGLLVYGLLSLIWRITIYVSLTLGACVLLMGAGIVLAALAVVLWLILPLLMLLRYLLWGNKVEHPKLLRLGLLLAGLMALGVWASHSLSYQASARAPVVVVYEHEQVVRAYAPGFVQQINVSTGQLVSPGTILARLENRRQQARLAEIDKDIALAQVRLRLYEKEHPAAVAVQREHLSMLHQHRQAIAAWVGSLTMRAKIQGIVITRHLNELLGRYLQTGDELLTIAAPESKILKVAVSQEDIDLFRSHVGQEVFVRMQGRVNQEFSAQLAKIAPRATDQIPHLALTAAGGGPLALVTEERLLHPCFVAQARPSSTQRRQLRVGETGWLRLVGSTQPVWKYFYRTFVEGVETVRSYFAN